MKRTAITSTSLVIVLFLLLFAWVSVSGNNNNVLAKKNAKPSAPQCDPAKDPICNLPPSLWFKA